MLQLVRALLTTNNSFQMSHFVISFIIKIRKGSQKASGRETFFLNMCCLLKVLS